MFRARRLLGSFCVNQRGSHLDDLVGALSHGILQVTVEQVIVLVHERFHVVRDVASIVLQTELLQGK